MHAADPEGMGRQIEQASNPAEVATIAGQFPTLLLQMAEQHQAADQISRALSALGEATTRRLLRLGEAELGPPPIAYAFIVAGSQARCEQIGGSDQDNAMILDDAYLPDRHAAYFSRLSARVCEGLAACGYSLCPGDIMASNPRWRLTSSGWLACFGRWISTPDPLALLHSSIFFDLRCAFGQQSLFDQLHRAILRQTRANRLFQGHLAASALQFRPPLRWYGGLRFGRSADGIQLLDLKKFGVTPVVDLARVHALASGDPALGTRARLESMRRDQVLSVAQHDELLAAFDFISSLRIEHQARRIRSGARPDSRLPRSSFTAPQQRRLKVAFRRVQAAQRRMARRFCVEAFK